MADPLGLLSTPAGQAPPAPQDQPAPSGADALAPTGTPVEKMPPTLPLSDPEQEILAGGVGATKGLLGSWLPPRLMGLDVAMEAPLLGRNPITAFNETVQRSIAAQKELEKRAPLSSTVGQIGGNLAQLPLMWPALAPWSAPTIAKGTPLLSRMATTLQAPGVAKYVGTGAGLGAGNAALNEENPAYGALWGALFPFFHVGGAAVGADRPINWAVGKFGPMLSDKLAEANIGQKVTDWLQGRTASTSPVGPLTTAQATDAPQIGARAATAENLMPSEFRDLADTQQKSITNYVSGNVEQPALQLSDATARSANAVKTASNFLDDNERTLWNVPDLQTVPIQTYWLKNTVLNALNQLNPALMAGVRGNLQVAMDALDKLGPRATVGDINGIRTMIRTGSKATQDNPWAPATGAALDNAFMTAMDRTLSSGTVSPTVSTAWQAARQATYDIKNGALSKDWMQNVLDSDDPSKAAEQLFDFSRGSRDRPQSIMDLVSQVRAVGGPSAGPIADELTNAARSQMATRFLGAGTKKGGDLDTTGLINFVNTNRAALSRSGILNPTQLTAFDEISRYATLLEQGQFPPSAMQGKFVDEIMSPWVQRFVKIGAPLFELFHHGAAAGIMTGMASGAAENWMAGAQDTLRQIAAKAIFDPNYARMLQTVASKGNLALLPPYLRSSLDASRRAATVYLTQPQHQPFAQPVAP
jgi:hypothetical protein